MSSLKISAISAARPIIFFFRAILARKYKVCARASQQRTAAIVSAQIERGSASAMNGLHIPGTPLVVDYWKRRNVPPRALYFLTHMHAGIYVCTCASNLMPVTLWWVLIQIIHQA